MRIFVLSICLSLIFCAKSYGQDGEVGDINDLQIDTAFIKPITDPDIRAEYDYNAKIYIGFDRDYPKTHVLDRNNYMLTEKNRPGVEWVLSKLPIKEGVIEITDTTTKEVFIYGDFDVHENSQYQITMRLPDTTITKDLAVIDPPAKSFSSWLTRNVHLTFDLEQICDTTGAFGVLYDFTLDWYVRKGITLNSGSNGFISTDNNNSQNSLSFDLLRFTWRHLYETKTIAVGGAKKDAVNVVGVLVKPWEVESTATPSPPMTRGMRLAST